ncbi:MAG: helix-turn-helix domain-containing protein [Leptolyngbya sp. BL-A-14]
MSNQMLQINLEQAERLKELGAHLQQFRQKQRISLETVALKTLIPVRLLAAIETGNVEQLPEPVYIQGFIRRYADAIGMNGIELSNAFPAQTNLKAPRASWRGTVQAQLRPLHLYLIYMALVIGAVSGLSYLLNRSSTPQMTATSFEPSGPNNIARSSSLPTAESKPLETLTPPPQSQKSVRVGLTMTAQSWVRIVIDGKTEFEGVLAEGTQREWEANKQLILRAGNAGGIMVSFNNGAAKRLGEPGAVEEVTFGANTNAAQRSASTSETLTAANPGSF